MLHTVNPVLHLESDRNAQRQAVRVLRYTTLPWNPTTSFPGALGGKGSACNARDPSWIPGSGRSPGEGNGNPLQYSCLKNSMDRGAWWAIVHGITKSQIWLSNSRFHFSPNLTEILLDGGQDDGLFLFLLRVGLTFWILQITCKCCFFKLALSLPSQEGPLVQSPPNLEAMLYFSWEERWRDV